MYVKFFNENQLVSTDTDGEVYLTELKKILYYWTATPQNIFSEITKKFNDIQIYQAGTNVKGKFTITRKVLAMAA